MPQAPIVKCISYLNFSSFGGTEIQNQAGTIMFSEGIVTKCNQEVLGAGHLVVSFSMELLGLFSQSNKINLMGM